MNASKLISVIIPCYRSEKNLEFVIEEITKGFISRKEYDYQIILVNDRSPDNTLKVIKQICMINHKVIGLDLTRNFGQASAKMAALPYAQGEYILFMDDDGQHTASGIFDLIELLESGYDVSYAYFKEKKHTILQRFGSWLNNILMNVLLDKPRDIIPSSFMAFKRFVAQELMCYKSPTPHIWGFILKITHNVGGVIIEHRKRIQGKSGYKLLRLVSVWLNGLTGFSVKPLRVASFLGAFFAFCSFVYGIILIVRKILYPSIQTGYASIMVTLLFIGGIIMIFLGLLGEYVGRIMISLNNIPQSSIREVIRNQCQNKVTEDACTEREISI